MTTRLLRLSATLSRLSGRTCEVVSGIRPDSVQGVAVTDTRSPWADQASFNLLSSHSYEGTVDDLRNFAYCGVVDGGQPWSRLVDIKPGDIISANFVLQNHADPDLLMDSDDRRGHAEGTRIAVGFSPSASRRSVIFGVESAPNTSPPWVAASCTLVSDTEFLLRPVEGSGELRPGLGNTTLGLDTDSLAFPADPEDSANLAGTGVLIGDVTNDGNFVPAGGANVELHFAVVSTGAE